MVKLEIFDPPMCCKTGICGSSDDPTLVYFASDLEWLRTKGVEVIRYGLTFDPDKFVANEDVTNLLKKEGKGSLPIMIVDGKLCSKCAYLSRKELAKICNIEYDEEDAPPFHREDNCCCGVDCDCSAVNIPKNSLPEREGSCENSPTEDNCISKDECICKRPFIAKNIFEVIFLALLLIVIGFVVYKFLT